MVTIRLKGRVTETGELEVELPKDVVPPGDVELVIQFQPEHEQVDSDDDERLWTLEEIRELTTPDPKTGAEIVALGHTGGWEHYGIEDSVAWVEEQRRLRREKRGW